MITPKIKALFQFIEFLHSNIEKFNKYNDLIKELESLKTEKNKNDFIKSKKIFEEKDITWTQKFQIIDLPESFQRKVTVRYFPTSIFIDRSGTILFRESGLGNISKLKKKFQLD